MKLERGDKTAIIVVFSVITIFLWISFLFLVDDIALYQVILFTLGVAGFIYVFSRAKGDTISAPKTKLEKWLYIYGGARSFLYSIFLKILSIGFVVAGIYSIFEQGKYWGLGIIAIILGPLCWYLSLQAKNTSRRYFEMRRQ